QEWDQARDSFQQARTLYQKAQEDADAVRSALNLRDRVLAGLPDYSRWLAQRYSDKLDDDFAASLEALLSATHALAQQLESPEGSAPAQLADLVRRLSKGNQALLDEFEELKSSLGQTRSPEDWLAYSAAAAVPFAESADLGFRAGMWDRLDNVREEDFE